MQSVDYDIPIADRIEGLLQPYENGCFVGQDAADARFLAGAKTGRLHHAWLLCGAVGVGKASFAFRIARAFTELNHGQPLPDREALDASSNVDNPVFRRIASGGHPNILHLRIPMDEKTKKFKTQLTVDEVRRSVFCCCMVFVLVGVFILSQDFPPCVVWLVVVYFCFSSFFANIRIRRFFSYS